MKLPRVQARPAASGSCSRATRQRPPIDSKRWRAWRDSWANPRHGKCSQPPPQHLGRPVILMGSNPNSEAPILLTIAEAATLLRRSARTLRRWAQTGVLRPVRVGKAIYFRAEDINTAIHASLCAAIGEARPVLRDRYDHAHPASPPIEVNILN